MSKQNSEQNKSKVHLKARIVSIIGFLRVEFLFAQFSNHCNTFAPLTQFGKFDKMERIQIKWNEMLGMCTRFPFCVYITHSALCAVQIPKNLRTEGIEYTPIFIYLNDWNDEIELKLAAPSLRAVDDENKMLMNIIHVSEKG